MANPGVVIKSHSDELLPAQVSTPRRGEKIAISTAQMVRHIEYLYPCLRCRHKGRKRQAQRLTASSPFTPRPDGGSPAPINRQYRTLCSVAKANCKLVQAHS